MAYRFPQRAFLGNLFGSSFSFALGINDSGREHDLLTDSRLGGLFGRGHFLSLNEQVAESCNGNALETYHCDCLPIGGLRRIAFVLSIHTWAR